MQFDAEKVFVTRRGMAAEQLVQSPRLLIRSRAMANGRYRVVEFMRRKAQRHGVAPSGFAAFSMQD